MLFIACSVVGVWEQARLRNLTVRFSFPEFSLMCSAEKVSSCLTLSIQTHKVSLV